MRSPKARKLSPKKCKTGQATGNIANLKFNTYNSGGSISLPSKESAIRVIEACDLRYYDHLALTDEHKDSVLVIWQNEKGIAALRDKEGTLTTSKIHNSCWKFISMKPTAVIAKF